MAVIARVGTMAVESFIFILVIFQIKVAFCGFCRGDWGRLAGC